MNSIHKTKSIRFIIFVLVSSLLISMFQISATMLEGYTEDNLERGSDNRGGIIYESEANNSISTANLVNNDDTVYGTIAYSGDIDYYKVKFTYNGQANFWIGNIPSGKDYDLYLYDSNGNLLSSSTSPNTSSNQELISHYTVSKNIWYYIRIVGYNCYDSSSYYTFRTRCYSVRNSRIIYDATCGMPPSSMSYYYTTAASVIKTNYGIEFILSSISSSSLLTGYSCPNSALTDICTSSCGNEVNCAHLHHKGSYNQLNVEVSANYYTYRLVGYGLCTYDSSKNPPHYRVIGFGNRFGKDAVTSTPLSPNMICSIQHELSHNLGATHEGHNKYVTCVLNGVEGYWCSYCSNNILDTLNNS